MTVGRTAAVVAMFAAMTKLRRIGWRFWGTIISPCDERLINRAILARADARGHHQLDDYTLN